MLIEGGSSLVLLLLAIILTINSCWASLIWDGDSEAPDNMLRVNLKKEFAEINEYLEQNVQTDQFEMNIKKAEELTNQLFRSASYIYSLRLIDALELFRSLDELEGGGTKCNMKSYRILLQNDRAADGKAHQAILDNEMGSLNRIQKLIHYASINHAESCYSRYPDLFYVIYNKMDQHMIDKVTQLLDGFINGQKPSSRLSDSEKIYNRFVFQPEPLGAWNFAKAIYNGEVIGELPRNSVSSGGLLSNWFEKKGIVNKKKANQFYKEKVQQPCDYYVGQLKNVFIPARYDAVFHKEEDDEEYYMSWARFRLCKSILRLDSKKLFRQVEDEFQKEMLKKS